MEVTQRRRGTTMKRRKPPVKSSAKAVSTTALPKSAQSCNESGIALTVAGRLDESVAVYERAIALDPLYAEAYTNLGAVLKELGRLEEAETVSRQAVALRPDLADAHNNLGAILAVQGRHREAMECTEIACRLQPAKLLFHRNLLACALYRDDLSAHQLRDLHQSFGREFAKPKTAMRLRDLSRVRDLSRGRKLKIGFLSSDFRDHPVASNLLPGLCQHRKSQLSLYFYAHVSKPDAVTEQFRALADGWCDISGMSDVQVAERIRHDAVDIMVYLAGRFDNNRPNIAALRPAPIQISLYDAATSGLGDMDYLVSDPWMVPRWSGEFFSERILRLPQVLVFGQDQLLPDIVEQPLPSQPVFGCFNNPQKFSPILLRMWGRILAQLPQSRLVLKYLDAYASAPLCHRILNALIQAGASLHQVEFVTAKEKATEFLARYNSIDVALDTTPFSGSTTTFQALAMGVPVVTLAVERLVSRMSLSILHAAGLSELATEDEHQYVAKAVALAADRQAWRQRRGDIRARLLAAPLCDGAVWAQRMECLYRAVWRKYVRVQDAERLMAEATSLHQQGRLEEAVSVYGRVLQIVPYRGDVHSNRGAALKDLGRRDEAIQAYGAAIAASPDLVAAYSNLGGVLVDAGRFDEAQECCRKAVAMAPQLVEARYNLANALRCGGTLAEAVTEYRQVVAQRPDYKEAYVNLGLALREMGRIHEAESAYVQAIALDPRLAEAQVNLGTIYWERGRLMEATACYEAALRARPNESRFYPLILMCALYREDLGPQELKDLHLRFGNMFAQKPEPLPPGNLVPGKRLKIGFLSSDFRDHPVACNLLPGLRHHDRARVSLYFYANVVRPDAMTDEFRRLADGWCDICDMSDAEVALRMREDGLDILVALAGRFDKNRPTICAYRAAPIQISLHDAATSGLAEMDYIVTDPWLIPRNGGEFFVEKPLRLPVLIVAEFPADLPAIAAQRPPGPPVFGCFNNPAKISDGTLALWGRILKAAPGSRLVLKYHDHYASEELRFRFLAQLQAAGATEGQVEFNTVKEQLPDLLARYNCIDVALDTSPFSGSTTTFQALCMGVPVVTLPADRLVGRWTNSMLHALKQEDWIAVSPDDYVAKAVALAGDGDLWHQRSEIRARLAASPLCDGKRWARQMERLYGAVWRKHCRAAGGQDAEPLLAEAGAHIQAGRMAEAANSLQQALNLRPDFAEGWADLGALLRMLGRLDDALGACRRAVSLAPGLARAHINLGVALQESGQVAEAAVSYGNAIAADPNSANAHGNLGVALVALHRPHEAVEACTRAVALAPHSMDAHYNLGNALKDAGRAPEALAAYDRALAVNNHFAPAHANRAMALLDLRRVDEAEASCRRALVLMPDLADAHNNLGAVLLLQGRQAEAAACYEQALRLHPHDLSAHRNALACVTYGDDISIAQSRDVHLRFAREFQRPAKALSLVPGKRLRIGFLSSDFRDHPVAANLLPGLRALDQSALSLHFYSQTVKTDGGTEAFRNLAEGWCDVTGMSDQQVAERIRADGMDVMIFLAGRFDKNRPSVAAWRTAPVQISLHDAATSGLAEMDYILCDPWTFPEDSKEYFSETPLRLPLLLVYDPPAHLPALTVSRPAGPAVLGCFNNSIKITGSTLKVWGRILAALPESRLVLKYQDRYASAEIRSRFLAGLGVAPERVTFLTETEAEADFLARYNHIDVALDTFPFSGSTTTFQALSMGVPVVTRRAQFMAGRWSAAILHGIRAEQWIARDDDDYVAKVVALVGDSNLRKTRPDIRARLVASPLCDGNRWAKQFESAVRGVCGKQGDLAEQAMALHRSGRLDEAVNAYGRLLAAKPDFAAAHCNLGVALKDLGRLNEAADSYGRAIAIKDEYAEAWSNLGEVLMAQGLVDKAVDACRRAVTLRPDLAEAHNNLGVALRGAGDLAGAVEAFGQAIAVRGDYADARSNLVQSQASLAGTFLEQGDYAQAITVCRNALGISPEIGEIHSILGLALHGQGRLEEGIAACQQAMELAPELASPHCNLGVIYRDQGRLDAAIAELETAIALDPDEANAHNNLGSLVMAQGRASLAMECYETAIRLAPGNVSYFRNLLTCTNYVDDISAAEVKDIHVRFGNAFDRQPTPLPPRDLSPGRRLKIGFLSSDFRNHPVASNLLPGLRFHDRDKVSLHFYSRLAKTDKMTAQFQALADGWRDVLGVDDAQLAEQIRADGIDVMIYLAGRFDDNRPSVAAYRAAPVQISLHDAGTSGLAEMDYILCDPWVIPRSTPEYFSERPLRLPQLYMAELPTKLPELQAVREPGPPVFGCFNNPAKITDHVLGLWARILAAALGSRLVLKYMESYSPEPLRVRFLAQLTAFGAKAEQVNFLIGKDPFQDFLARHNGIDVALDTFPFSGATTTFQALTMGLPVVTRPLPRMVSRWTMGMLHQLGLDDLITGSDEDYIAKALDVAAHAEEWRNRRPEIRARLAASPLCDGQRWARQLERLYGAVWRKYCASVQPVKNMEIASGTDLAALATRLHREGRWAEALPVYEELLVAKSNFAEAHCNYGAALKSLGRWDDAVSAYERALALRPDYAEALSNLSEAHLGRGRVAQAEVAARRAVALRPDLADTHNNLGAVLLMQGRAPEAAQCYEIACRLQPGELRFYRNALACSTYRDDVSNDQSRDLHLNFGKAFAQVVKPLPPRDLTPNRRLKIGFVSSDFRDHPVAGNLLPGLRAHDRAALSLHFYSVGQGNGGEFRHLGDGWHDVAHLDDAAISQRIRADGMDILVILAGHFDGNRLSIAAHRAAPVQISLYDGATSGLAEMDYLISDPWTVPRNTSEYFSEKVLRLPTLLVADFSAQLPEIIEDRPAGPVVFGCFNSPVKFSPSLLRLWGRVLEAVPDSKLVLKYLDKYQSEELCDRVRTGMGVAFDQVEFLTEAETLSDFLARYNAMDIALDTFPFNGVTTTLQALSMGVPVVSLVGDRLLARSSVALLRAVGLQNLVVESEEDYVTKAVALAGKCDEWRRCRGHIRDSLAASSLSDGPRWARQMERLYRATWRKYCRNAVNAPSEQTDDPDRLMVQVLERYAEGKQEDSAALLGRALALRPDFAEGWSDLGAMLQALGRNDEAIAACRRAIILKPDLARAHSNLGVACQELGRMEEAVQAYTQALDLNPENYRAHSNLAAATIALGNPAEAVEICRKAIAVKPDYPEAHINLGNALKALGRLDEADAAYRKTILLKPNHAGAYFNLGQCLADRGRGDEAQAAWAQAAALDPRLQMPNSDTAEQLSDQAALLHRQGHLPEAEDACRRAIALAPGLARAHTNLGVILQDGGRLENAVAAYEQAIALDESAPKPISNLSVALLRLGRVEAAEEACRRAVALAPEWAEAHSNLGNALRELGRLDEALAAWRCAITLRPDYSEAHRNLGLGLLLAGDYAEGWREYESRSCEFSAAPRDFAQPRWNGEALGERTLLVTCEQGLGDTIQFVRFVGNVDGRVVLQVQDALVPLLQGLPGIARVVGLRENPGLFHVHLPLLSLPRVLGVTLENLPAPTQYLSAPDDLVVSWRQRLPVASLRIGIVWQGNPAHPDDAKRSIPLRSMARLAAVPGVRLISLQRLYGLDQLPGMPVEDLGSDFDSGSFADTAAIIQSLDLVVSADTSVAHLAGALGVPVWVALPLIPDWRWLLDRDDSPWYPSARVFRQNRRGHWDGVFQDMVQLLAQVLETPVPPAADPDLDKAMQAHQDGDFATAWDLYRQVLHRHPDHAVALHYCGVLCHHTGKSDVAVEMIRRSLAMDPHCGEAYANLGMALRALGRLDEAAEACTQAIQIQPGNVAAHFNLGNCLSGLGKLEDSLESYRQAVKLAPNMAQCRSGLAEGLRKLGRVDEALIVLTESLAQRPNDAEAWNCKGACHYQRRDLDAAIAAYEQAIRHRPDYAEDHKNLGAAQFELGNQAQAIAHYRMAIAQSPDYWDAHFHLACALLRQGDFPEGWAEYEWRRRIPQFPNIHCPQPEWQGESLAGKTILLYGEQGFGDVLQFCRYAPILAESAAKVILVVRPALVRLLESLAGNVVIIPSGQPVPAFHVHVPLLSVPGLLGTDLATIPAAIPYLHADKEKWRERLANVPGMKVGLVWSGDPRPMDLECNLVDRRRSLALAQFAPLAAVPGVTLVSLQKGAGAAQVAQIPGLLDVMDEMDDFADTASLVSALDLVISVDTSMVHLTGALGVPVWVLSRFDGCWRWLLGRDDSPWYPSAKMYRQSQSGEWGDVMERIAQDLRQDLRLKIGT